MSTDVKQVDIEREFNLSDEPLPSVNNRLNKVGDSKGKFAVTRSVPNGSAPSNQTVIAAERIDTINISNTFNF